jgi:radical SAM superfamily enzyme YgiQ (UPF0313 family)
MFATEASIDLADDAELMELMTAANISSVFIGIETTNEAALRETKKVQNLRPRGGTVLDKVRRIQQFGMEVWCGIIVGFDNDDAGIFADQSRFLHDARIASAMVNMLVAIPRTPLYKRLASEGRLILLEDEEHSGGFGTNVVPLRISREALFAGYIELMRELYAADAYFSRLDELYLDPQFRLTQPRTRYLRRHPLRWLKCNAQLLAEAAGIFVLLMRGIPDAGLRREYRRRLMRLVWHRREPQIIQTYAVKCAMHYHAHRIVQRLLSRSPPSASLAA